MAPLSIDHDNTVILGKLCIFLIFHCGALQIVKMVPEQIPYSTDIIGSHEITMPAYV